ncbi:MAG: hypothetical protein IJ799_02680 [Bacteroidales bacterium]|nr:hypothetical protein [Bacteroidales bacterium]
MKAYFFAIVPAALIISCISANGQSAVDLGLSVKWASCNLGASKPEDSGDYYAWGETSVKSEYSWETLLYCDYYDPDLELTKYNTDWEYAWENGEVDNKTRLDYIDDAARKKWGGKWRMPTDKEWTELRENCTWTWTTLNGKNGYKVTSKKNGNSIFLPAAGYRSDTSFYFPRFNGFYWSSSLHAEDPKRAWVISFDPSSVGRFSRAREDGLSVRPVSD